MRASTKKPTFKPAVARSKAVRVTQPAVADRNKQINAGSKQARVIAMLRSPTGTTVAAMMKETDWQQHSVRGFLAGVVRKKLKLKVQYEKVDGTRVYRISDADSVKAGARPTKRRAA
jgi:hypothetical protein